MNFSLSTVINTFIITSLFICIAALLIHSCVAHKRLNLYTIFFMCAMAMLRLLFPFEFPFTYSIYIKYLWNGLHSFLNHHYLHFYHLRIDYMHFLPVLWAIGSSLKLMHSFYTWRKTAKTVRSFPEARDPCALRALEACNAAFKNPVPVRLLATPCISSPFITGIRRPTIVIPDIRLTEKEWSYIFAHELSHYYKGHLLCNLFLELLSVLYFWNPFLFVLKKQFYRLLEFNADERAVSSLTESQRIAYSECLVKMMRRQSEHSYPCAHGIYFNSSGFKNRIRRILNNDISPKAESFNRILLLGTSILFLLSYAFILEPQYDLPSRGFTMDAFDTYYLSNGDGTYDVIHNNEYLLTTDWIFDEQIPIKER